jgi:hypothetical protein
LGTPKIGSKWGQIDPILGAQGGPVPDPAEDPSGRVWEPDLGPGASSDRRIWVDLVDFGPRSTFSAERASEMRQAEMRPRPSHGFRKPSSKLDDERPEKRFLDLPSSR